VDMGKWMTDVIAADRKRAIPILSFPAIQKMGVTVAELIGSAEIQAEAMKVAADCVDAGASVSFMDLSVEAEAFGSKIVVSDDEVPTVIGAIIDEDADPEDVSVPKVGDGRTGLCVDAVRRAVSMIEDRPVLAGAIGPFSLAGRLMDVNEVMVLCYEEPELVHAVLDKAAKFIIEYVEAFKGVGANGVILAEPLAGLLPPDFLAEFSTPYVKRVVEAVQDDSFIVVYHNCGSSVVKSAEAVIATGAAGFHFGNAVNMSDIVPLIPADCLVMGNVDPAGEIKNGTPESVRAKTLEVMESCCGFPNFVISTGCDIPPMAPWENIEAFFAAVDEFYQKRN